MKWKESLEGGVGLALVTSSPPCGDSEAGEASEPVGAGWKRVHRTGTESISSRREGGGRDRAHTPRAPGGQRLSDPRREAPSCVGRLRKEAGRARS